jgi:hypothetical protein
VTGSTDWDRWRWGKALLSCYDDLKADLAARDPAVLDREVIPNFDGSANGLFLWLICARSSDVPRLSAQEGELRVLVTTAMARRGFSREAQDSLGLNFTSREDIEAGGGRFYYFR